MSSLRPGVRRGPGVARVVRGTVFASAVSVAAVSLAGTLALWALASASGWVDKVLLPSPFEVLQAFAASVADGVCRA